MAKVTFTDKDKTGVSPINKWRDIDANEVKAAVNELYDMLNIGVFAALSAQATTEITASDTYTPIAGTFSNSPAVGFVGVADPAIKYTGTKTMYFEIDIHASLKTPSNNTTVTVSIKKSGVEVTEARMTLFAKTLNEVYNFSGTSVVELDTDDTIQLVVKSDNGADVTFVNITTTIRVFSIPTT